MNDLLIEMPGMNTKDQMIKEILVILENYCSHKRCKEWLSTHPNVNSTINQHLQAG